VIDYILHHGPEYANIYFKFKFYSISVLEKFQYFDEYGHDQGQKVRDKAANIANLLLDEGRLHSERRTWASMRERILVGRGEGVERQIERSNQEDHLGYIESSEATLLHPLLTPRTGSIQVDGSEDRPRQPPYTTHGTDGSRPLPDFIENYLSWSSEAPENDAGSLRATEWGKPSLLPEQQLRADLTQSNSSEDSIGSARQLPYYAAADGTRDVLSTVHVPIPFTSRAPLQFTDDSALLSDPSLLAEERIHPENPDAEATLGDVQSLLASWERRCRLSTIVAPDGDSQGLPSRQASKDLEVVEAQIATFLTHILDSWDARCAAQELEGSSAQLFVDAIQNVGCPPFSTFSF
jgi:hypothetical protein